MPPHPGFAGFIGQDLNRREDEQEQPVRAPEGSGEENGLQKRRIAQGQEDEAHRSQSHQKQAVPEPPYPEKGFPVSAQGQGVARAAATMPP